MATSPARSTSLNLRIGLGLSDSIYDIGVRHEMSMNKVSNLLLEIGYQYVQSQCKGSIYKGMADVHGWIAEMYGDEQDIQGVDSTPKEG